MERGARKRYQSHSKILILSKGRKTSLIEIRITVIPALKHLLRIQLTTTKCKEDYLDSVIISLSGPPRQHWPHTILEQEWHQGNKFMLISDCSEAKVMTIQGSQEKTEVFIYFFKISLIHSISFSFFSIF